MTDSSNVNPSHLQQNAFVYVRQSSPSQIERNQESTKRQYALVDQAIQLGWSRSQVSVIDDDLGLTGAGTAKRDGFARMTAEVALGHVGIVLRLKVSRLARNNADWYRLLDLCGMTDTLIGDIDGVYHPGLFNDRLVLGLKGTMSEAELHTLRVRLDGGIRNKAQRGELRRGLPVGFVWGEAAGEVRLHPDESVTSAIQTVFERFTALGSARQVWLWFRSQQLSLPLQTIPFAKLRWVSPSYHSIHQMLTNPVYAGAYVYGKSRHERYVDDEGNIRKRVRRLPRSQWAVFIPGHHPGYIDWETYEVNLARIGSNTRPRPHQPGGAVREGNALLQGLATCGHCARALRTHYRGRNSTPGYHCANKGIVEGRGVYCLNVGGVQIDAAVSEVFLEAIKPAGVKAALRAAEQLEANHDAALEQWRLSAERARYEAERAERQYRVVEPENRLVARGLETKWEQRLSELQSAETELATREKQQPRALSARQRKAVLALGSDLTGLWSAPTTSTRDRKELLRTLLEEVIVAVHRDEYRAHLTLRWRGGALTERDVELPRSRPATVRTDEDTVELIRRLAAHYPDGVIAGILNQQGRKTARGLRFDTIRVTSLRQNWNISAGSRSRTPSEGELLSIREAAKALGIAPSTLHRWVNDGFIAGEQLTPNAPWRIRLTDELRSRFVEETPHGFIPMIDATKLLGVTRQTVLQRVKRGELDAVHVYRGRRKGLRIKVIDTHPDMFNNRS